jgi:hypothetical protein
MLTKDCEKLDLRYLNVSFKRLRLLRQKKAYAKKVRGSSKQRTRAKKYDNKKYESAICSAAIAKWERRRKIGSYTLRVLSLVKEE